MTRDEFKRAIAKYLKLVPSALYVGLLAGFVSGLAYGLLGGP